MTNSKQRYIVKDKNGGYQSAYNLALGKNQAYSYAVECARRVNGVVFLYDEDIRREQEIYRTADVAAE